MSDYYKEKALQATLNKIESHNKQTNFFIRNIWKVIGFGIFVSIWAPTQTAGHYISNRKTAIEVSGLSYHLLVLLTGVLYIAACFLAHFVWKKQDEKTLKKLLTKKNNLELELGIKNSSE